MHAHTEQLSWKISLLLIAAICLHLQGQNNSCGRYFWLALFLLLVSAVNSCTMQKMCRIRNAPTWHYPAQEAEGQDLEEIHNWGLDLNEVSELEAWHVQKLVQHCAARHPSSLLGLLPCAKHKYPLEGSCFCCPRDWISPTQAQRGLLCRRSSVHLDSWAFWAAASPEMFC